MAWNRQHAGLPATPDVAIDWSVTAMTEAAERLTATGDWELHRLAAAVGETGWWVTLVRYHPRAYAKALADTSVKRRKTEETLAGLRYVRNQIGKSADPAVFVQAAPDDERADWPWCPLPEPALDRLGARARQWELGRYRAYQARLAGHDIARTFTRCTDFLAQAAQLATGEA